MNKRYASLLAIFVIAGLLFLNLNSSGVQADSPTPTPTPTYYGVAGIEVTDQELAKAEAEAGIAGTSSEIDSDYDGCNDAEEVVLGLDPSNFFDFPDVRPDGHINVHDTQSIAFRWGTYYGSAFYDVRFDMNNGTVGGGPDGDIDIHDLQQVYGRFGMECQGVPAPTISEVCAELEQEAVAEGITLFNCGGEGAGFPAGGNELPQKMRVAQVTIADKSARVIIQDLDLTVATEPPPAGAQSSLAEVAGGSSIIPHSDYCNSHWCHVVFEFHAEVRHFFGHGPNCAWMRMRVEHDEFSPWAAIYNVDDPVVWGEATVPCEDDNMVGSLNLSGLPMTLRARAEVDWKAGIPTPWGYIGVRSWHAVIDLKSYANYTYDMTIY